MSVLVGRIISNISNHLKSVLGISIQWIGLMDNLDNSRESPIWMMGTNVDGKTCRFHPFFWLLHPIPLKLLDQKCGGWIWGMGYDWAHILHSFFMIIWSMFIHYQLLLGIMGHHGTSWDIMGHHGTSFITRQKANKNDDVPIFFHRKRLVFYHSTSQWLLPAPAVTGTATSCSFTSCCGAWGSCRRCPCGGPSAWGSGSSQSRMRRAA